MVRLDVIADCRRLDNAALRAIFISGCSSSWCFLTWPNEPWSTDADPTSSVGHERPSYSALPMPRWESTMNSRRSRPGDALLARRQALTSPLRLWRRRSVTRGAPLKLGREAAGTAKRLELQHAGGLRTKRAIGTEEGELWPFERATRPPGPPGQDPFRP